MEERFAQKFKKWRLLNNLSQEEVAEALGMKQVMIHYWENGTYFPRWTKWKKIEELTEGFIRADELLEEFIERLKQKLNEEG